MMGLSTVKIAIIVGWVLRGLVLGAVSLGLALRPCSAQTRALTVMFYVLFISFAGSLAEFAGVGLRFARLTEIAVASIPVVLLYGAIFKLDPPSLLGGLMNLVAANVLYTLAAVTTDNKLEAGLIVLGAVATLRAVVRVGNGAAVRRDLLDWILLVAGLLFYVTVLVQTIFGPWVLKDWNFTAWVIIWEVAITLFYSVLAVGAWFSYVPSTADGTNLSDWFDMIAYVLRTNQWAEPRPKTAD